jgi:signal transduction histidine kinase
MKARVALVVAAAWVLVGVVWGVQSTVGGSLQGSPVALGMALRASLVQSLPWIPVTLAIVYLVVRFPLTRKRFRRSIWVHLAAVPIVAFAANVLVVLGFWFLAGRFDGVGPLVRSAALWAAVRLHVALLVYAAIAALTQALVYFRDARERELTLARVEGQLARARLNALTAQIRPHFLFNTLHTIGQLWRSGRHEEADSVLDHLGALFHKVQDSTSRTEVPLAEELELVREYLAIEEVRFRDRLRASVTASPAALECRVPPLFLQPLVENAVRHGISVASTAGRLEVEASLEDGRLVVEVRDDGPGMAAPGDRGLAGSTSAGVGLRNTRERLEQLYGADGRLDIRSAPGGGTTVRVEIPARNGG